MLFCHITTHIDGAPYDEDQKDAALYEEAMNGEKEAMLKADPQMKDTYEKIFFPEWERKLKKLQSARK